MGGIKQFGTLNIPTVSQLIVGVNQAAEDVGEMAQDEGRYIIDTSPTERDWSHFYYENPRANAEVREPTGRNETGEMREQYKYSVTGGGAVVTIDVGWVDGDKGHPHYQAVSGYDSGQDGYFGMQEWGFNHRYAGWVDGMEAQDTSQEIVTALAPPMIVLALREWMD